MKARKEPAWVAKSLEAAAKLKPTGYVYVMARSDGWHKIGVTSDQHHYRKFGVAVVLPACLRPVVFVKSWPVYGVSAYKAEKMAHRELTRLGYERDVGFGRAEWFSASERVARRVARAAIREAQEQWPEVSERMMRNLGKSGRNG